MILDKESIKQLYNTIQNQGKEHQLIQFFVSPTVDSLCAVTILTEALKLDGLKHSITPISNYDNLKNTFKNIIATTNIHTIFFIDCCGSIDIEKELFDSLDKEQFRNIEKENYSIVVIDSHRPFHNNNIESNIVKIIVNEEYSLYGQSYQNTQFSQFSQNSQNYNNDHNDHNDNNENNDFNENNDEMKDFKNEKMKDFKTMKNGSKNRTLSGGSKNRSEEEIDFEEIENEIDDFDDDLGDLEIDENQIRQNEEMVNEDENAEKLQSEENEIQKRPFNENDENENFDSFVRDAINSDVEDSMNEKSKNRTHSHEYVDLNSKYKSSYTDGDYYSESVSRIAAVFCQTINKFEEKYWWYVSIGIADQYLTLKIDAKTYFDAIQYLQDEMDLPTIQVTESLQHQKTQMSFKIDCQLLLLRHWNLYDSLYHTKEIASKLGVWNVRGQENFRVLLADMGIPLQQAMENYSMMLEEYKISFLTKMQVYAKKYHFENLFLPSLFRKMGMDYSISNFDACHALQALIENDDPQMTWLDNFWEAQKLLKTEKSEDFATGFAKCIETNKNLIETGVLLLLSGSCLNEANKFRFCSISDNLIASKFKGQTKAVQLCQLLADMNSRKYKKWLPFVLALVDNERRMFTVVGYSSPISQRELNYFGVKFMEVVRLLKMNLVIHNFDSYVVNIHRENLNKFKKHLNMVFEEVKNEKK